MEPLASVVSLWRYPIKSMLGEELNSSAVTQTGLVGDRAYALVDSQTGKVASAKNPTKWGKLFDCRAAYVTDLDNAKTLPPVKITLPDGRTLQTTKENVSDVLSKLFGRSVKLMNSPASTPVLEEYWPDIEGLAHNQTVTDETIAAASPAGTFFDYAVLHFLTTATLDQLRSLYPEGRFESRRFRPNFVLQLNTDEKSFFENRWIGKELRFGNELVVRVTDPCSRCVMTTLPQGDLPRDPGILRTAAKHNKVIGGEVAGPDGAYAASVGVYARVLNPGIVHRGDPVAFA
jgi:MOSC domain-containing protein